MSAADGTGEVLLARPPRRSLEGVLPAPDVAFELAALECPDRVRFELNVSEGYVAAVRYRAEGCPTCSTAAARLAARIEGESLGLVDWLEPDDVVRLLDEAVPESRRPCAVLPLETLRGAVRTFRARWDEAR